MALMLGNLGEVRLTNEMCYPLFPSFPHPPQPPVIVCSAFAHRRAGTSHLSKACVKVLTLENPNLSIPGSREDVVA